MFELLLANSLSLPPSAITETFAVLGTRGSGKTHTATVLVEQMTQQGLHVVVIDPVGAWWGLRVSADGRGDGLPIPVLGGIHGDADIMPEDGARVSEIIVREQLSSVLDLSLFSKSAAERFVADFAEALYQLKARDPRPLHVVIDEADAFAPQQPFPGQQRMIGAVTDIVRRGRMRGLGVTLITQRPAQIAKNVLELCEVLIAHRTIGTRDRKAVDEWVKANIDEAQRRELLASLAALETGEAFVSSASWLKIFARVRIHPRKTFDSSRTPEVGETADAPTARASIDVERLRALLGATADDGMTEGAAAEVNRLHRHITDLESLLADASVQPQVERVEVEVPVLAEDDIERMELLAAALLEFGNCLVEALSAARLSTVQGDAAYVPAEVISSVPSSAVRSVSQTFTLPEPADRAGLRRGEFLMLQRAAQYHPRTLTRQQLALLSGYAVGGGTFSTYLSTLRRNGLIVEANGQLTPTADGLEFIGEDIPPRAETSEALFELWSGALRAGERSMLRTLIDHYPGWISRDQLANLTGYEVSGGTFSTYLSTLRRAGLARVNGSAVSASPDLFIEA